MLRVIEGHNAPITAIAMIAHPTLQDVFVVSGDAAGRLRIYDVLQQRDVTPFEGICLDGAITLLHAPPFSNQILCGTAAGEICAITRYTSSRPDERSQSWHWDVRGRTKLSLAYGPIHSLALSPDRRKLRVGWRDACRMSACFKLESSFSSPPRQEAGQNIQTPGYFWLPDGQEAFIFPMEDKTIISLRGKLTSENITIPYRTDPRDVYISSPNSRYLIYLGVGGLRIFDLVLGYNPSEETLKPCCEYFNSGISVSPTSIAYTSADIPLAFTSEPNGATITNLITQRPWHHIGGSELAVKDWFRPLSLDYTNRFAAWAEGNLILLESIQS